MTQWHKIQAYMDSIDEANWARDRRNAVWYGSDFYHIHELSSGAKGKLLRNIAKEICEKSYGITDFADVVFKTSVADSEQKFMWQQIRPTERFSRIIFVGCTPSGIVLSWCDKTDLFQHVFVPDHKQHGDSTFWFTGQHTFMKNLAQW